MMSAASASAATVLTMMHNTPFGDIVDTEDDLQPYIWRSVEVLTNVLHLLSGVLGTIEVNADVKRERALSSFATTTELADTLVREAGCTLKEVHTIVSRVVQSADADGIRDVRDVRAADVTETAHDVCGRRWTSLKKAFDLLWTPTTSLRSARPEGGVVPSEVARMAADRLQNVTVFADWHRGRTEHLDFMAERLLRECEALRRGADHV
jgi:argininosuccinate lyase